MEQTLKMKFPVDTEKNILSSECQVHKTERFIKDTRRFTGVDIFLSKISEGVILNIDKIWEFANNQLPKNNDIDCFKLETEDGEHTFYFRFGYQIKTNLSITQRDIVFFKYIDKENVSQRNDQRFVAYLKIFKNFNVVLYSDKDLTAVNDFKKLYNLSNSEQVNFPLLNAEQNKIVTIEDQNVLVQGVAGSGKTNICINKIIFTACRAYMGRVLYTTFSRGLLIDTQNKVDAFKRNLQSFVKSYEERNIIFADKNHKKAIENKLGVSFAGDDEEKIIAKIKRLITFLEEQVDYFLLEDMYAKYVSKNAEVVDENYFIKVYTRNIKNHQLTSKLVKVKHLSYEVIFKEIYGMILGCYDLSNPKPMITLEEYTANRKESFSRAECEVIYSLANDYAKHLQDNKLVDKNLISRKLLEKIETIGKYSIAIIDEVQDMTEVNLCLMKSISRKLFCVGDALQMINPSYFSFAYLKRLLFEKDIVSVAELSYNYRNTKRIEEIIESLGQINISRFGTHSFVLKGESIDSEVQTSTVFVKERNFIEEVAKQNFDNFTVIVASTREKEELRKVLAKQEILTVSEIKGLERDTVILYDILSSNIDKWQTLERTLVNRKCADENSVYRYYFNLFYVGVSRAKSNLYVVEEKSNNIFKEFFEESFENLSTEAAIVSLNNVVSKMEDDPDEIVERVNQFINLGQFDNARFAAGKILEISERSALLDKIDIYEKYIYHGNYREAGIKFWEKGMFNEAKKQFTLSNDEILSELVDACTENNTQKLDIDVVKYLADVQNNSSATNLIIQTVKNDLKQMTDKQKAIKNKLKNIKEKINGK